LETPLFSMGKKQRLTTKKGKKVSPNASVRTRVNAALADFKEGKQGNTKKSICKRHGVAVSLLNRYIKHPNVQKGDASTACYELLTTRSRTLLQSWLNPSKLRKQRSRASTLNQCSQKMATLPDAPLTPPLIAFVTLEARVICGIKIESCVSEQAGWLDLFLDLSLSKEKGSDPFKLQRLSDCFGDNQCPDAGFTNNYSNYLFRRTRADLRLLVSNERCMLINRVSPCVDGRNGDAASIKGRTHCSGDFTASLSVGLQSHAVHEFSRHILERLLVYTWSAGNL
jgi:hypothetical protein